MKKLFLYLYFLLFSVNSLMAQDIKGRVVDASGQPIEWLSGNLVGISINLCKSIQKELFINDTP